jgi:hypothetical protein
MIISLSDEAELEREDKVEVILREVRSLYLDDVVQQCEA